MIKISNRISKTLYTFFCFIQRKRLKNHDITIISQNCLGGVIYHDLGLQFKSPTINLWIEEKDFFKFACHLKYYLSRELHFVQGIDETPTAYLDDVLIHFNHYSSEEEAASKWNERTKRVNYDNVFVLCSDRRTRGELPTEEDIALLKDVNVAGKCVFTNKKINGLEYLHRATPDVNENCVTKMMFEECKYLPLKKWQLYFDYVFWLNTGHFRKTLMLKLIEKPK